MPVRLFVGNLPYEVTEDELRQHFAPAGPLFSVFIPIDRETGKRRGFAFVEFNEQSQADEAIRLFHQQQFKGRPLAVNVALPKEARGPGGPRPPMGGSRPPMGGTRPPMGGSRPPMGGSRPPMGGGAGSRGPSGPMSGGFDAPQRSEKSRRFGPDAKPARNRQYRPPKFEGGKKPIKERLSGRMFGADDVDDDAITEPDVENFAESEDDNTA